MLGLCYGVNSMEFFFVGVGLLFGCVLGFMLSTMMTVKRNIQDIHNAVCPSAEIDRKPSQSP
jgi:hypothetical protein